MIKFGVWQSILDDCFISDLKQVHGLVHVLLRNCFCGMQGSRAKRTQLCGGELAWHVEGSPGFNPEHLSLSLRLLSNNCYSLLSE